MPSRSTRCPSWKGYLAVALAVLEGLIFPALWGGANQVVPAYASLVMILATVSCVAISLAAAFSRRAGDIILAVLASFLAGYMFFGFVDIAR